MRIERLAAAAALGALLAFSLGEACAYRVGIMMPTQNRQRWYDDGAALRDLLRKHNFETELFYGGDDDIPIQKRQVKRLVAENYDAIVLCPIDGAALSEELEAARRAAVPVIAYDRLLLNTGALSYYVTFDNFLVGIMQGQALLEGMRVEDGQTKYLELFYGSSSDSNAGWVYAGMMSVVGPYIARGQIVIRSGQTSVEEIETPNWSGDEALKRMDRLLASEGYKPGGQRLDGVWCASDGIAVGVVSSLTAAGYTARDMPVITGQDASDAMLDLISRNLAYMSVRKPAALLNEAVLAMLESLAEGREVPVNDTASYHNGVFTVKSYLCRPEAVSRYRLARGAEE